MREIRGSCPCGLLSLIAPFCCPPPSLNGTFHCSMVTMGWGQSFRTGPSFKSRSLLMAPLDQKGDLGRLLSLQSAFFLV